MDPANKKLIVCQSSTKLATSVYHNEFNSSFITYVPDESFGILFFTFFVTFCSLQGYFVGTESPVLVIIVFGGYPTWGTPGLGHTWFGLKHCVG